MQAQYDYHTLRCNFSDLQSHLNEYATDHWRLFSVHHDSQDDKIVRVIMERPHKEQAKGGF